MNPPIRVKDMSLWFGEKQVLKNVSLEFKGKKITALIGPSGCGKSTLLRALNRMHDLVPSVRMEGLIHLHDLEINSSNANPVEVRRRVGMVFQKPNPFPMSVFDNIAYGLKINGVHKRAELSERVEKCLREAFLWDEVKDDLKKSGLSLSGGQQQRLCIARAIALRPEVILMDEPCSALDPISTARIEELMLQLKENYTIVIVTHNMQQALRVADFTAVMYLGEMVEFGKTKSVFENPQSPVAKNYLEGAFG